jgi:hypothetical protein
MKIILFCIGILLSILHPTSHSIAGSVAPHHSIDLVHRESMPTQNYSQGNGEYLDEYLTGILDDDNNESERKNSLLSRGLFKTNSYTYSDFSSKFLNNICSSRHFPKLHHSLFIFLRSLRL